ncbi:hypothetical protein ES703_119137 [subsurface metagenome]
MEFREFLDFAIWHEEQAMDFENNAGDAAPGTYLEAFGRPKVKTSRGMDVFIGEGYLTVGH